MRILIANDDGYLAPGLAALVTACEGLGTLDVVAPEQNASGTSNSLTLNRPLSVYTAANGVRYINGTPSDCVHVALTGVLQHRPDLVVSGINQGANMGDDTLYSGTVAAAMEGFLFGIPSIAFSQIEKGWTHLDAAARVAGLAGAAELGVSGSQRGRKFPLRLDQMGPVRKTLVQNAAAIANTPTGLGLDSADVRRRMVERLRDEGLRDERVLAAISAV